MYFLDFLKFCAYLIIAGTLFRTVEYHFPDTWVGRSLGTIY